MVLYFNKGVNKGRRIIHYSQKRIIGLYVKHMISKEYDVLLKAFKKNKDRVSELVENADEVIYYDELKDIIGMRMDGDMYSLALEEVLGVKNCPSKGRLIIL